MGIREQILYESKRIGEIRGEKRGIKRGISQVVTNMLRKNLTDEMIADFAGIPLEYVQEIKNSSCKMN